MSKKICLSIVALILLAITMPIIFAARMDAGGSSSPEENLASNPYGSSVRITIRGMDGGMGFCSGTLIKIDKQKAIAYLLTAGHCLQPPVQQGNPQPYPSPYPSPQPYPGGGCPGGVCPINPYPYRGASNIVFSPSNYEYLIDFGPGTRQVMATYAAHEVNEEMGDKDIGLLTVPVDMKDIPYITELIEPEYTIKVNDNVYHIGYPNGREISIVGSKITSLTHPVKGPGFSIVNFPPKNGRSGGGIFYPVSGSGEIYTRGKIFGVMTNVDMSAGTGIFSNHNQIYSFFKRNGIVLPS